MEVADKIAASLRDEFDNPLNPITLSLTVQVRRASQPPEGLSSQWIGDGSRRLYESCGRALDMELKVRFPSSPIPLLKRRLGFNEQRQPGGLCHGAAADCPAF